MEKALVERLRELADIQVDIEFCGTLLDAADMIEQLAQKVDDLEKNRNCITVEVKYSEEQMREAFSKAFESCTGKNLDYVFEAIKEKKVREGEANGQEEVSNT